MKIFTTGHSNRRAEEFISLLEAFKIELLLDIRAFPVSRRNPQFNRENLEKSLAGAGIQYLWMGKELGGFRKKPDGLGESSPNKAWKRQGFRRYADYMMSDTFKKAIERLVELASEKRAALMCAEKHYWKCHRQLVSDYLYSQGHEVWHIIDKDSVTKHQLSPLAEIKNGILTYPEKNESLPLLFEEPEENKR